jgi:hypothetical protein
VDDLDRVRTHFESASRPYLRQPWSWLAWALILPAAALASPTVLADGGPLGLLILWSLAVFAGGVIEATQILRSRRAGPSTTLSAWVLRAQGNLSLVALFVSIALLWQGVGWMLPGVWLLLLGHSLYTLGGMAFAPLRISGLIYQLGGVLAIWPHQLEMRVFALTTFVANLWVAWSIWRGRSESR